MSAVSAQKIRAVLKRAQIRTGRWTDKLPWTVSVFMVDPGCITYWWMFSGSDDDNQTERARAAFSAAGLDVRIIHGRTREPIHPPAKRAADAASRDAAMSPLRARKQP